MTSLQHPYFPNWFTLVSIRSTYTADMSKKTRYIDISAQRVDTIDKSVEIS